jgi:hypothetical protein
MLVKLTLQGGERSNCARAPARKLLRLGRRWFDLLFELIEISSFAFVQIPDEVSVELLEILESPKLSLPNTDERPISLLQRRRQNGIDIMDSAVSAHIAERGTWQAPLQS